MVGCDGSAGVEKASLRLPLRNRFEVPLPLRDVRSRSASNWPRPIEKGPVNAAKNDRRDGAEAVDRPVVPPTKAPPAAVGRAWRPPAAGRAIAEGRSRPSIAS